LAQGLAIVADSGSIITSAEQDILMRGILVFVCSLVFASPVLAVLPGFATSASEELAAKAQVYQLKVVTTHGEETISGSGVWMGYGKALTASHLFAKYQPGDSLRVELRGKTYPATLVAWGLPGDADLALLAVQGASDIAWNGPPVCTRPVSLSAPLRVVSYDKVLRTFASPDRITYSEGQGWSDATTASMSPGVSGSPVFDGTQACLTGIISEAVMDTSVVGGQRDEQIACKNAARGQAHAVFAITCAATAPTRFTELKVLRAFLKDNGVAVASP
jgi:hypothetical protein